MGRKDNQTADAENHDDRPVSSDPNALGPNARGTYAVYAGSFDGPCDEHAMHPNGEDVVGAKSSY